jgi:prepilin-type processing-associated H-X9-DG protein
MDENLVGYLLNALDPETQRQVEAHLAADPQAREKLEVLRRAIEPLAADRDNIEPPPGLAVRTLGRVAEFCCRDLPRAPRVPASRAGGANVPFWRRADVLVAACLLLTALGIGIPLIQRVQADSDLVACKDNLRKFYAGLKTYKDVNHNKFPNVAEAAPAPRNVVGLVMPMLADAGTLPERVSVSCPASGGPQAHPWTLQELRTMDPEKFRRHIESLAAGYGYSLGHRAGDVLVGPRFDADKPNQTLPLMADCPPLEAILGNSRNHGGKGQNVLFQDGHVTFCTTRDVGFGGDDIYVNKEGKVAPGVDWKDGVLGGSAASPNP